MGLNGAIASHATGTYTVTRRGPGTYVGGVYQPASASTLSAFASVQPVDGRDLHPDAAAQWGEEVVVVYTETPLRTRGPAGEADLVSVGGEDYEVKRVESWTHWGATHYRAYAARIVTGA